MHSSRPPKRKLTQKEPITAEIKNAAPAQIIGLNNQREQYIHSTAFRRNLMRRAAVLFHPSRKSAPKEHVRLRERIYILQNLQGGSGNGNPVSNADDSVSRGKTI